MMARRNHSPKCGSRTLPPARTHTLSRSRMAWLHIGLKAMASLYSRTACQKAAMAMCSIHSSRRSCINQCSGSLASWRAKPILVCSVFVVAASNPTQAFHLQECMAPDLVMEQQRPHRRPRRRLQRKRQRKHCRALVLLPGLILCAHHTLSTGAVLHAAARTLH